MTALLRTQRDRMRQPGFVQLAAASRAYVDAVALYESSITGVAGTAGTTGARDSRPLTSDGAAAAVGERAP